MTIIKTNICTVHLSINLNVFLKIWIFCVKRAKISCIPGIMGL